MAGLPVLPDSNDKEIQKNQVVGNIESLEFYFQKIVYIGINIRSGKPNLALVMVYPSSIVIFIFNLKIGEQRIFADKANRSFFNFSV